MKIKAFCSGPVQTNTYLAYDDTNGTAVLFDAPMESTEWVMDTLHQTKTALSHIILTHSHWDHTADAAEIRRRTNALILVHPADEYRLLHPNDYLGFPLPYTFEDFRPDGYVAHGEKFNGANTEWEIRHTPGHTEGGVCLVSHSYRVIIVGDTLFAGSVGRTDLHGGNMEQLVHSIHSQLLSLPDDYLCLPGHGTTTTIGEERESNPFL